MLGNIFTSYFKKNKSEEIMKRIINNIKDFSKIEIVYGDGFKKDIIFYEEDSDRNIIRI